MGKLICDEIAKVFAEHQAAVAVEMQNKKEIRRAVDIITSSMITLIIDGPEFNRHISLDMAIGELTVDLDMTFTDFSNTMTDESVQLVRRSIENEEFQIGLEPSLKDQIMLNLDAFTAPGLTLSLTTFSINHLVINEVRNVVEFKFCIRGYKTVDV